MQLKTHKNLLLCGFLSCISMFFAGCSHMEVNTPSPTTPEGGESITAPLPDYFLMEPTRLTKGHIFLRRTPQSASSTTLAKTPTVGPYLEEEALAHNNISVTLTDAASPSHGEQRWEDIRKAKIFIHTEDKPFQALIEEAVATTAQTAGPWRVQWKIKRENRTLLNERFSLNTETNFDRFATSVASFILNHRGIDLNFELFDSERVLVISDVFTN